MKISNGNDALDGPFAPWVCLDCMCFVQACPFVILLLCIGYVATIVY